MAASLARRRLVLLVIAGMAVALAADPSRPAYADKDKGDDKPVASYRYSGPYTHDNLTLFLIHGADQIKGKDILTLEEALKAKKVIVHETKDVNQLAIENVSDKEVFLQAGDIVRGGQQDRIIAFDLIVPPKSGKVPLAAFCVEAGRWRQRGAEAAHYFNGSVNQASGNALNQAFRKDASQSAVWENVGKKQMALKSKLQKDVMAKESASSLELTLSHKNVVEALDAYVKKLQDLPKDKKDVIGCAVVINGKVHNAEVYASSVLFGKLWPKLLKAASVEAVAEFQKGKKFEPATVEAVTTFLADADKGKQTEKKINGRFHQIEQESAKTIRFETKDREKQDVSLRRSHLAK
jgi:hypothetical protein